MRIEIHPSKVWKALLIMIIFLVLAHTAGQLLRFSLYNSNIITKGLLTAFCLDNEANIPAWYASTTLFICSILLAIITFTKKGDRYRLHWGVLSIIFLFLSIDEAAKIHELTGKALESIFGNFGGIFYYSWVVIGIPLIFILIITYMKFLISLSRKIQFLFVLSGILYVVGGLGIELIGSWLAFTSGTNNLLYGMLTALEELLEMLGVAVFIYALLTIIQSEIKEVIICFSEKNESSKTMK